MANLSTTAVLQQNALFRGLSAATLGDIASLARRRRYSEGAEIFSQGDEADALYSVASGRVRLSVLDPAGHEMFLSIMDPGDTFGEMALIDGLPRTAGATAVQPSILVVILRDTFLSQLRLEPELAIHLLERMCARLRSTSNLFEDSVFLHGPARIAKRLTSLIAHYGQQDSSGIIELRISQAELGHFLGLSRQIVNRCLQAWHKAGLVDLNRGAIVVRDLAELHRIAKNTDAPKNAPV